MRLRRIADLVVRLVCHPAIMQPQLQVSGFSSKGSCLRLARPTTTRLLTGSQRSRLDGFSVSCQRITSFAFPTRRDSTWTTVGFLFGVMSSHIQSCVAVTGGVQGMALSRSRRFLRGLWLVRRFRSPRRAPGVHSQLGGFRTINVIGTKQTEPNKSLQATRDGAFGSAARFTLAGPACLSSSRSARR